MMRSVLLAFLGLAAAVAPAFAQLQAAVAEPPMMQPGDRLEISIYRNPELSGVYTVTSEGTLLHPLFEEVRVAGVSIPEARARMDAALRKEMAEPLFTFEPHYRVYVGGAVRQQGQHFFPQTTVGQAIIDAGGSTAPDRRLRIRLIRDGEMTVTNLDGRSETALLQTQVEPGDQILLEERPTFTRNYLGPAMQVLQTVTALVATYVYFDAIFGS